MMQLVECPRDAMQGWKNFIPTETKVRYINQLLKAGFHTIDFGSFVSPAAIPQMADTAKVLDGLDLSGTASKLLAIVANERGAKEASEFEQITYLGFPFSVSPTFQQRNTNSTQAEALKRIDAIQNLCLQKNKKLVVYLSMGFGNPYGDDYNKEVLLKWADEIIQKGISIVSLADTIGIATAGQIAFALNTLVPQYPNIEFGVHLHCRPENMNEKLQAALQANCKRFDSALKGIGGCPMAADELVGNMPTEFMVEYFRQQNIPVSLNEEALKRSLQMASTIFV